MLPDPSRGLIVSHCYVWLSDYETGREVSDRPHPVLVISVRPLPHLDAFRVLVLAITHAPPYSADAGLEIPDDVKATAGLDAHRQWVMVGEANAFTWPGPDLRNLRGRDPPTPIYGTMPHAFLVQVVSAYLARRKSDPTGAHEIVRP